MVSYNQTIKTASQKVYYGVIQLADGTRGNAVFVSGTGGVVTIFDPGEQYMTLVNRDVGAVLAPQELSQYTTTYSLHGKVITKFTLYQIDPTDGSSTMVLNGSLADAINFFS